MPQDQFGRELPADDDPIFEFHATHTRADQARMLLLMVGISSDLPALEHADEDALKPLLNDIAVDMALSENFHRLLNYLRS